MIILKRGTTSGKLFACQIVLRLLPLLCRGDMTQLQRGVVRDFSRSAKLAREIGRSRHADCETTGDLDPTRTVVASSARSIRTWTRRGPNSEAEDGADEVF
jgi:hypothetical protein